MNADTGLLSPGWAGSGIDLSDEAWIRAMLAVEVALADTQAELGVIPQAAADAIGHAARSAPIDIGALVAGVRATANPVVALVAQLTAAAGEHGEYVHRGSTSQDILDSATMLLCAATLNRMSADLQRCAAALAGLVEEHLRTPMAGRTLTQHAVPITFGLKAAGWLQLVLDALDRIGVVAASLPVSLGGAGGTLSAYAEYARIAGAPEDGLALMAGVAARLGLAEQTVPWHVVRTPVADVASVLTFTSGALGKLAVDVQVLTRTEIREVSEPAEPGRGASSAMPQKHNPVLATMIATAARQVPAYALVLWQSMVAEDERPAGAWHAEWQPLRECLRLCAGAAVNAAELVEGLVVSPERMRANLAVTGAAIVSERVNAVLAPRLGKVAAKTLLTGATQEAERTGRSLAEVLGRAGHPVDDDVLDPARYTGSAVVLAQRVLHRYRSTSASRRTASSMACGVMLA